MNEWDKIFETFFHKSINILNKHYDGILVLQDRVYTQRSILSHYSNERIDEFYDTLQQANQSALINQWNELFGDF